MKRKLNTFSSHITEPRSQSASQAMLYGTGLNKVDMAKAQVGIASMWFEGNPCNMHLLALSEKVKQGVTDSGLVGMRFNTIGVSDGMSMGTSGMNYSLQSRDLIADSIETVMRAQWYDACIALPGCDKNMPGCMMALARVNRPSLIVYGGTIQPGCLNHKPLDVVSAFQSYGEYLSGAIDANEQEAIVRHACPGPGACGGMYTANTMASALEAMGMILPYGSSIPAVNPEKITECIRAGHAMRYLLEHDIKPRDIVTKKSLKNAMVVITALGGSTNAVLHLIAIACALDLTLTLDEFQQVSDAVPFLADLKPSGRYLMADLHAVGGVPAVMKYLLKEGYLDGDCLTVTGKTVAENIAPLPELRKDQEVIFSIGHPIKKTGHLQILRGNLAPEGSVAKITGKEGSSFTGAAQVFDSENDMIHALENNEIKKGSVVVIRYVGPKGGPGMPEMLKPTSAIMGMGLGKEIALITDGRFSGGSHGFIVGHIAPEAQEGGPIALIQNGDVIHIDIERHIIQVDLHEHEWELRRHSWIMPPYKASQGTLYKYIKTVSSASNGCVTDQ